MKTYKAKSICTDFKPTNYTSGNLTTSAKLIYTVPNNCIARLVSGMYDAAEASKEAGDVYSKAQVDCFIKINNTSAGSAGAWIIGYNGKTSESEEQPTTHTSAGSGSAVKTFIECPAYLNAGDKVYATINPGNLYIYLYNAGTLVLNFIEEYDE